MKTLLITLIIALSFATASAQDLSDELYKQVEVTKDYVPDVNRAIKLSVAPRVIDTVSLRPEIDYSITSTAWMGNFGVTAINPVKLNSTSLKNHPAIYFKAGLGYPSGSVLDGYYVGSSSKNAIYGASINHSGDYGKIVNDLGNSVRSKSTNNEISIFGAKSWNRMQLGAEIDYNFDLFTDYGQFSILNEPLANYGPLNASTLKYQTPEASVWFGNDFTDMDQFNFRVDAGGYYLSDNTNAEELGLNAGLKLGQRFAKRHTLLLSVDYDTYKGRGILNDYSNSIIRITPQYIARSQSFLIDLGAELAVESMAGFDNKVVVLPKVKIDLSLLDGYVTPFIDIDGRLHSNNFRNNITENPYILPIPTVENSIFYDFMSGIKGNFTPTIKYKLNIGYSLMRDYHVVANLYHEGSTARFTHIPELTDDGGYFTIGGEIFGQISNRFFYDVSANYYNYKMDQREYASGLANYDAELNLKYAFSDNFRARVGTKLLGDRHFYVLDNTYRDPIDITNISQNIITERVDPVVNLNVGIDVDVSRRATVFLDADNILGSKLYTYNHYNSIGLSCIIGVKITF